MEGNAMADNSSLSSAKNAKNDEFYTQYSDIEAEMNAYVEFNPNVFKPSMINRQKMPMLITSRIVHIALSVMTITQSGFIG